MLVKIHVVQKGDTLWKLAQKYGVDFEKLKQANPQLADPDQLMPGMKIKIPVAPVPAKSKAAESAKPKMIKEKVKEVPKPVEKAELEKVKEKVPPPEPKKEDHELLKALIKKAAPYVLKKLLQEEKPEVINQIKIELDMDQAQHWSQKPHYMSHPPLPKHPVHQYPSHHHHHHGYMMPPPPVKPGPVPPPVKPKPADKVLPEKGKSEAKKPTPPPKGAGYAPCPPTPPYLPHGAGFYPGYPCTCGPTYLYPPKEMHHHERQIPANPYDYAYYNQIPYQMPTPPPVGYAPPHAYGFTPPAYPTPGSIAPPQRESDEGPDGEEKD